MLLLKTLIVSFVMILTELSNSYSEFINSSNTGANDHSESILGEEAGRGENQAALLLEEFLTEFNVTGYVLEFRKVKVHHHVHGSICSNRLDTSDSAKLIEGMA